MIKMYIYIIMANLGFSELHDSKALLPEDKPNSTGGEPHKMEGGKKKKRGTKKYKKKHAKKSGKTAKRKVKKSKKGMFDGLFKLFK